MRHVLKILLGGVVQVAQQHLPKGWTSVSKAYFQADPARACFTELDDAVAGTPLWPHEEKFDASVVTTNLQTVRTLLQPLGGRVFWGHVPLQADRQIPNTISMQDQPQPLATTFVSGFFIPKNAIHESRAGFYIRDGQVPLLSDVVSDLQGTWLMSNLGYFLTRKLIEHPEKGGAEYSHNARHPETEHLDPSANSYLGGYVVRTASEGRQFPPLFQSGAVAVASDGQPHLIEKTALQGGRVTLNGRTLQWSAADVNPQHVGTREVAIYTPAGAEAADDWSNFRRHMGAGRFNIVISNQGTGDAPQAHVAYTVKGECLQPANAVVISCRDALDVTKGAVVQFDLDPWCDADVFRTARYIYEGLLPLTSSSNVDFGPWQHPHACLTQETFMANPRQREPRTVLVQTERYFGAIAFSGRYELSLGISFSEIGPMVKALVAQELSAEKIQTILNLDGGSASKLCVIQNGIAKPLTWVAPGGRNRMGDPNGNTYSCLFLKVS